MLRATISILLGLFASANAACSAIPATDSARAQPMRGVWLTNIASDALKSRDNIREAVALCSELGFNTIFVVTWNGGYTLYPSDVLQKVTGKRIHPDFEGRDPLKELIDEAKTKGISVHAWFEFGFAASHKDPTGGPLLQKNPHWASRDQHGKITEKNGFQWMNAFHPEVQAFITGLIMEVINRYDVDGIQGDDRLPAMPSNGGYDPYTIELYKKENAGKEPPANEKDPGWIKWRSGKLNLYLKDLARDVRAAKPGITISMAPSIYPWSVENYLQDWPEWLNANSVDVIIPQIYRYQLDRYTHEMDKILDSQLGTFDRSRFFPGILLQVDDYNPDEKFLGDMIAYNRKRGIEGEVFFFYEGIRKFQDFFRRTYSDSRNKNK